MAAILYLHFGRCSQLPYSVAIKTCSLHQPPQNPALPGFILIGIKIVNSFRNYLINNTLLLCAAGITASFASEKKRPLWWLAPCHNKSLAHFILYGCLRHRDDDLKSTFWWFATPFYWN